jgi:TetR/AcrR family transcriptional regulator, transcriptional repressor of bet genes
VNERQAFFRADADQRRADLIAACADVLAAKGVDGASVRSICAKAGVSPGLLRHYFEGIDDLIGETYRATGRRVSEALNVAVDQSPPNPRARLLAYLTASFRSPIADAALLSTWLAFWSLTRSNPAIAAIHAEIYADYRQDMERLIADLGAKIDPRLTAIALTALVDGLWLELSLGNAPFSAEEASDLAERWLEALLIDADRV